MLKAAEQDIKDQTLWMIANMERAAQQAVRQATEGKKSGWAVLSDLAEMYGQEKAIRIRRTLVRRIDEGEPAAKVVEELLERAEDDVMSWTGSRSSNQCSNVISDEEQRVLIILVKELRNAQKHLARTVAIEAGLGMDVATNQ